MCNVEFVEFFFSYKEKRMWNLRLHTLTRQYLLNKNKIVCAIASQFLHSTTKLKLNFSIFNFKNVHAKLLLCGKRERILFGSIDNMHSSGNLFPL